MVRPNGPFIYGFHPHGWPDMLIGSGPILGRSFVDFEAHVALGQRHHHR